MLLPLMSSPPGKALHTSHSVIAAEVWKTRSMLVCARKSRAAETCTTVFSNGKQHADVPTAFKGVSKRLGYAQGSSNMNTSHSCYNKSFILYSVLVNPSIHNGRYHSTDSTETSTTAESGKHVRHYSVIYCIDSINSWCVRLNWTLEVYKILEFSIVFCKPKIYFSCVVKTS